MSDIKREEIKQEVFDLYDDYAHNRLDRREFAQKLSAYAVGGITVASLMSFLMPNYQGKGVPSRPCCPSPWMRNSHWVALWWFTKTGD